MGSQSLQHARPARAPPPHTDDHAPCHTVPEYQRAIGCHVWQWREVVTDTDDRQHCFAEQFEEVLRRTAPTTGHAVDRPMVTEKTQQGAAAQRIRSGKKNSAARRTETMASPSPNGMMENCTMHAPISAFA
eukprot:2635003-Rhodomonas_salina.5